VSNSELRSLIYEDEALVIINKPSGILTVPAGDKSDKDMTTAVNNYFRSRNLPVKIFPCHRLDKETTGVLIFSKGRAIQQKIMQQFKEKKVKKTYIAFIQGKLNQKKGIIKSYIQGAWPYKKNSRKKLAITKYKVLKQLSGFSVMKLEPITGRTNQIRLQFKNINHPLVGERRFALAKDWPIKFKRTALHASEICFEHPLKNKKISFHAGLPKDMNDFLLNNNISLSDIPNLLS
jgi:23S rRNA pseudouridine1911/1915/1917 synthase